MSVSVSIRFNILLPCSDYNFFQQEERLSGSGSTRMVVLGLGSSPTPYVIITTSVETLLGTRLQRLNGQEL